MTGGNLTTCAAKGRWRKRKPRSSRPKPIGINRSIISKNITTSIRCSVPITRRMGWVHLQLAEMAQMRDRPDEVVKHQDAAEKAYEESLYAWVCAAPENNILGENWGQLPYIAYSRRTLMLQRILGKPHGPRFINNIIQFYGTQLLKEPQEQWHVHFDAEMFENLGNVRFMRGNLAVR